MTTSKQPLQLFSKFISAQNASTQKLLVFIHGWGMHGDIWSQVVSSQSENFNCLIIDLPGMGRSPIPEGDYSIDYINTLLDQTLSEYIVEFELYLVGWSLGAIVAASYAASHSKKVNGLFLVSMGSSFIKVNENSHGMPLEEFLMFQALLEEDFEGTLYRFLGLNTKGSAHQRSEIRLLQQLVFSYGIPARKALRAGLDILKNHSLIDYLNHIQIPVTLVLGENDALVPAETASEFCKTIKVVVLDGAGHIPFLSQLDQFNQQLSEYMK